MAGLVEVAETSWTAEALRPLYGRFLRTRRAAGVDRAEARAEATQVIMDFKEAMAGAA